MPAQRMATPNEMRLMGALAAVIGFYFMLTGLGVLPVPGGPRNLHAPLWVVFVAGLAFFLGGLALLLQAFGRANANGEFPSDAPFWIRLAQYLIGVTLFASFALIPTWIAFGGEARSFSGGVSFLDRATNITFARLVFGFGAAICWFAAAAFALSGGRKLMRGGRSGAPGERGGA